LTAHNTTKRIAVACRDSLFGGALASSAEASTLRLAIVDSLDHLATIVTDGEADGIVTIDPSAFPPDLVMELAGQLPVLVVGRGDDPSSMIAAVEAGALGYADQEAPLEDLLEAIQSVVRGVAVIPPPMLGSLLRYMVERQRTQRRARERLDVLSARERQVFELTARGFDKQAVADQLFISPATARTHVQNAFRKLNVHSVADLVALAAECGLDVGPTNQRRSE
jgi:DNA-binding NarL/FixJ family response regulator